MAKRSEQAPVYDVFNRFLKTCILGDHSLLWPTERAWTEENVAKVKQWLVDTPILGDKSFEEKLQEQMKDAGPHHWMILVDVLAAHRHDPPGDTLEDADQVPRLILVHGDHVEHHLGSEAPELAGEAPQVFPVARDTADVLREIRLRQAPVEHDDLVTGPGQPPHRVRADEVRAADDEDPYLPASPPVRMATSSEEGASRRGAPRVTRRTKPAPICLG